MDERTLGKRLQLARRRASLTQQELCQKAGLSYSTLAKIERGAIRSPSVFTVAAIAGVTGTPFEDLLDVKSKGLKSPGDTKKRSKTGVRFVYFDVDGVLLKFLSRVFSKIGRDLGVSMEIVENAFWRYNDTACRGEISLDQFNDSMAKELHTDKFDWPKYYLDFAKPNTEAMELLKWTANYYDVGLLSNNMPGMVEELRQRDLLPDIQLTAIVNSHKVGAVKPEPKIYEVAQEQADVEANEILLIDDIRPNLTAADRAGWQIIWYDELNPIESVEKAKKILEF